MRVLVTGHEGYIGSSLVPLLLDAGHEVVGMDTGLFHDCRLGLTGREVPATTLDVRDVHPGDLAGFDAIVHLAAISNDPLGDLNPQVTYDINHRGTVRLALAARAAGVERFLFSSSCSLYGAAGDEMLTEEAGFNPVTPYGRSKVLAEADLAALASDGFSPTFLRNATVYGVSDRLRIDLVVNNLTAFAVTTGEVLMRSDGSPVRPLVHVDDVSAAFLAVLEAPRDLVHCEAFNVGRTEENYRIHEVAEIVEDVVEGSVVHFADGAGPDLRNYRVDCDKLASTLPSFRPAWTVPQGVVQLAATFAESGLEVADVTNARFLRIKRIEELLADRRLDDTLRFALPARIQPGARAAG